MTWWFMTPELYKHTAHNVVMYKQLIKHLKKKTDCALWWNNTFDINYSLVFRVFMGSGRALTYAK